MAPLLLGVVTLLLAALRARAASARTCKRVDGGGHGCTRQGRGSADATRITGGRELAPLKGGACRWPSAVHTPLIYARAAPAPPPKLSAPPLTWSPAGVRSRALMAGMAGAMKRGAVALVARVARASRSSCCWPGCTCTGVEHTVVWCLGVWRGLKPRGAWASSCKSRSFAQHVCSYTIIILPYTAP